MPNLIGHSIGRYHILEQLGEGGMATVYKAYDTRLETDVAVKVIRTETLPQNAIERSLKRFEREAKSLAKLTHPNIVKVTDFGEYEGKPYLVMVYLPGGTLKAQLGKPIHWTAACKLLLPIADALDYAHDQGLIHRDVKPANILLTHKGQPMLSDFGIAKILETDGATALTGTGMGVGTPDYMAPEQWSGKTSPQTDIYALGVVLYEMLTGRKPYTADTPAAILLKQATEPLPRPANFAPGLPETVEKVLFKALARKPEERYARMADFEKALEILLGRQSSFVSSVDAVATDSVPDVPVNASQATIDLLSVIESTLLPDPNLGRQPNLAGLEVKARIVNPKSKIQKSWFIAAAGIVGLTLLVGLLGWLGQGGAAQMFPTSIPTPTATTAASPTPALGIGLTQTREKDGMVMVYVPAGSFTMGSDSGTIDERPAHAVTLDAFWIDQTEVTNGKYARCLRDGDCSLPADNRSASRGSYFDDPAFAGFPVIKVSWYDASSYCKWAGGRLPREAEWEKAARGTDERVYPWGETLNGTYANYGGKDTTSVAMYESGKSPYGAYDMAGNVLEWVDDYYGIYQKTPSINPTGPSEGEKRVARGGSWLSFNGNISVTARFVNDPLEASETLGFRCIHAVSP